MTALRLALLPIVLYLSVDFANPHVPGAVSFEVNDCVDGIRLERPRASAERPVMTPIITSRAGDAPAGDKTPRRPIIAADPARRGVVPPRHPRRVSSDSASAADDH